MVWSPTGWYDLLFESETRTWEVTMHVRSDSLCTAAGRLRRSLAFAAAAAAMLPLLGSSAWAQSEETSEPAAALRLIKIIPINGTAGSPNTQLFSFDISFVDPKTGLYYLADRSNRALDVIDTTGAFAGQGSSTGPDTLFGQIGGSAFNFGGDTGLNMPSNVAQGPNGVVAASPCIFATDGLSRVVSINSNVSFVTPMSSVSTGGMRRADELAIDPKDSVLLVINNAYTPVFGTLISFSPTTCALTVGTKIPFTAANGINATNGAEQPVWDPLTQRFYVS